MPMPSLREDAVHICRAAIEDSLPDAAVQRALSALDLSRAGRVILLAVGKAAWQMANAAYGILGARIDAGAVITKYAHAKGPIGHLEIYEAGHPIPDESGVAATERAMALVTGLSDNDRVLLLISGGGSALFEKPLVALTELADVTAQLLACGADIREMNCIRKRLSAVKGGRFALLCAPARVDAVILSDVIGDPPDMIASGPTVPDTSTCADALRITETYGLRFSPAVMALLAKETPKETPNAHCLVVGGVKRLCETAARLCREAGYETAVLTSSLTCEAREAGAFFAAIAREHADSPRALAYLACGETVVTLRGKGLGGRCQELALAGAIELAGIEHAALIAMGSDGTDGPTDAAGAIADGETATRLREAGVDARAALSDNDAYHALEKAGALVFTGATGTNVNDIMLLLIDKVATPLCR